jgi:CBS-domain-containing membrane protein
MRVAELLVNEGYWNKQPPLTCGQTVENAARRMEKLGLRALPICRRDGSIAGVIAERDIVIKVVARSRAPELCTVDEVMSTRFVSCYLDDPVDLLARLFDSTGFECAVVRARSGELAGILTAGAVARLGAGRTQTAGEVGREKVTSSTRERGPSGAVSDRGSWRPPG